MSDTGPFKLLIEKFCSHDVSTAAFMLEGMKEEEAVIVLGALPSDLVVRILHNCRSAMPPLCWKKPKRLSWNGCCRAPTRNSSPRC
jgi:hypothetical protein